MDVFEQWFAISEYNWHNSIVAIVTEKIHPELFDGSINFYRILTVNAQIYFSILGVSAIQFWLSLRFKNFITPLSIGIGLWFLGPMMEFQFKWSIVEQYPYAFSMLSVLPKYEGNIVYYQWYSVATALIFLGLAFVEFRTRKVRS